MKKIALVSLFCIFLSVLLSAASYPWGKVTQTSEAETSLEADPLPDAIQKSLAISKIFTWIGLGSYLVGFLLATLTTLVFLSNIFVIAWVVSFLVVANALKAIKRHKKTIENEEWLTAIEKRTLMPRLFAILSAVLIGLIIVGLIFLGIYLLLWSLSGW